MYFISSPASTVAELYFIPPPPFPFQETPAEDDVTLLRKLRKQNQELIDELTTAQNVRCPPRGSTGGALDSPSVTVFRWHGTRAAVCLNAEC